MSIGLGIDTGGTYTDAVLLDFSTGDILAEAKAPTTHGDLAKGIHSAMAALPKERVSGAAMVALSTTLATNACVEDRGCRVALFLLGYREDLVARLAEEYGLQQIEILHIRGSHGQKGQPLEEPNWAAMEAAAREVRSRVDALGVVEYWGVRNPEYEMRAKAVLEAATGLPVAAAHELTGEINSMRRAATTALNARLIPLLGNLLHAVGTSMRRFSIAAPLMIVRGDGSLMTEAFAREHPVETLLSGPAASVIGGLTLAGMTDAIFADIGGTTTDLAIVRQGRPVLTRDGVTVGRWRTGTRAIAIRTAGLGGDSSIGLSKKGQLTLGPRRAVPLSALASEYPQVRARMREMLEDDAARSYSRGEFLLQIGDLPNPSRFEGLVLEALAEGPMSIEDICARVGSRPYFLNIERLEYLGAVIRSTLTPTDFMHLSGEYAPWDVEAARYGARLLARQLGMTVEDLRARVFEMASERLYRLVSDHLLQRALAPRRRAPDGDALMALGFEGAGDEVKVCIHTPLPVVGIGAPTHLFLPRAAGAMEAVWTVPEHAGVANAVGAITGSVCAEEDVVIKPQYTLTGIEGYSGHSSAGYARFEAYEDAVRWARTEAERIVRLRAEALGAMEMSITVDKADQSGQSGGETAQTLYLETHVLARAMGKAAFAREA